MTERPIIFSAPMIRAILADRKTMTRRVVKPRDIRQLLHGHSYQSDLQEILLNNGCAACNFKVESVCPYGKPGDRLWVRETWGEVVHIDWHDPRRESFVHVLGPNEQCIIYREEATRHGFEWVDDDDQNTRKWRSPIHMPRWASRITLEVVSVKVERVQDISEADAAAEGIVQIERSLHQHGRMNGYGLAGTSPEDASTTRINAFLELFYDINKRAPRGLNPWVWCVTFKRIGGAKC